MVVEGLTFALPFGSAQELQTALSIESAVGVPPVICQLRVTVVVVPEVIVVGDALRVSVKGTVTVVVWGTALPPGPVALMVNVVVDNTGTMDDHDVARTPVPSVVVTAGVIVTDVALVVAQVIVVVSPPFTVEGIAANCVITG